MLLLWLKESKFRLLYASIGSSIAFSLLHLFNIFKFDLESLMNQIVLAFVLGLFFCLLLIRTKNLFFVGILHCLINILGSYKNVYTKNNIIEIESSFDYSDLVSLIILTLLFSTLISIFILRTKKFNENIFLNEI